MFNLKNPETIGLLLSRRSEKSRRMIGPGPSSKELERILRCGLRVPDHGKIAPWRFVVITGQAQQTLSEVMAQAFLDEGGEADSPKHKALQEFPVQAPVMIAALSTPDTSHKVPVWEQRLSIGAACQNILVATHALGYVGQWLTGDAAYLQGVKDHFELGEDDRIAGFLFLGSSEGELSERPRPAFDDIVKFVE